MALTDNETWRDGFVVHASDGSIVTTIDGTNATWQGGFLRDRDGRLVVRGTE